MVRDVVLVRDEDSGDRGVVLVSLAAVAVHVGEILLLKLHHQLLEHEVILAEALDLVVVELVVGGDRTQRGLPVPCLDLSPDVNVQEGVDALACERRDPLIESVDASRIEAARVTLRLVDDRRVDPSGRVVVVDANQIVAQPRQASCLLLDRVGLEDGVGCHVRAPEPDPATVLELEAVSIANDEAELPGGLVVEEADIDG
jgi:hypothetical protein